MAVRGADAAVRHPGDDVLSRQVDVDRLVDAPARPDERLVEGLGLDARPGEAVEDRAARASGWSSRSRKTPTIVASGTSWPRFMYRSASRPSGVRAATAARRQVARRQDRDAEVLREQRRLGSLARPGRTQENDHRHRATV